MAASESEVDRTEVYLRYLPRSATEASVRELLKGAGTIRRVWMSRDADGACKGFAFVNFSENREARECVLRYNAHPKNYLDGKHVVFGKVTSGLEVVKAVEKLGSHGCRWRMIWRSTEDTGAPCLPYSGFRPATVSRLMKTSRETTAGRSGRWWWPSSAHSMCPAAIQRKNVEVAASFSTESAWPCPTMD